MPDEMKSAGEAAAEAWNKHAAKLFHDSGDEHSEPMPLVKDVRTKTAVDALMEINNALVGLTDEGKRRVIRCSMILLGME